MNRLILFLLLAIAGGFAAGFVADLQGYFSAPSKPIAYLQDASGTVRRLPVEQLTWDRAQSGSLFAAKDTVQTGENGFARLVFYAGGELELGPGAMVALSGGTENVQLQFLSGEGKIRVTKSGQSKISVQAPQTVAGQKQSASRIKVEVVERLKAPTDKVIEKSKIVQALDEAVIRDKKNVLDTQGKTLGAIARLLAPTLQWPNEGAKMDLNRERPKFAWRLEASKGVKHYEFLLKPRTDDEEEDAQKVRVYKTQKPEMLVTKLKAGKYLWSVRAVNEEGMRSPSADYRNFEIERKDRTPALAAPLVLPVRIQ